MPVVRVYGHVPCGTEDAVVIGVTNVTHRRRTASLVLAAGLALSACSKDSDQAANQLNPALNPGAGGAGGFGAGVPGSAQDFRVNVGDRVFFDTDSPELSGQAMATLDRPSGCRQAHPQAPHQNPSPFFPPRPTAAHQQTKARQGEALFDGEVGS